MSSNKPTKLLWMDLEMTGLDPEKDRILEVGAIVTDFDFNELDTYEAVIRQTPEALERLKESEWYEYVNGQRQKKGTVYDMASQNGLLEKVQHGEDEAKVREEVAKMISKNFDQLAILAGNSIHQDRRFVRQWWPEVEELLHYRMLDATSYKVLMQGKYGFEFNKPDEHRALEDIRGSIQEVQYYLKKLPRYLAADEQVVEDNQVEGVET